jgi:hypothetical protein
MEMQSQARATFDSLDNEVIWIHAKWKVYRQIFAGDKDQIDILNRTAPFFFRVIQQSMFEDLVLALARLTDPPETYGKSNRSLSQFVRQLDASTHEGLISELLVDLSEIEERFEVFKAWRNKRIAHSDLSISLKVSENPLPGISRAKIEEGLDSLRKFMNRVHSHLDDSHTAYEHFSTVTGGERLLQLLLKGEERELMKRQELLNEIDRLKGK